MVLMEHVDARFLEDLVGLARPHASRGQVASYIPALGAIPSDRLGVALARTDGTLVGAGDWEEPFSIQSVSKAFAQALVLAKDGDTLWSRVGREPSGNPFNSLVQLEYEQGIPRNPFINAGALVVCDRMLSLWADPLDHLLAFLKEEAGQPSLVPDAAVAASEAACGSRNAALAHFMASCHNMEHPVEEVLRLYFSQCAIRMSCADMARAGLFLARHGLRQDGSRLLSRSGAKRINAIMLTCGTYDAAGDVAYRVGLPAKSGVGGGILAILPERGALAVWGPALDRYGNSVAGLELLDAFTTRTGWSVF